jgi:hypothetical protein
MAKQDEFLMNFNQMVAIMNRYKRVLLYALPGEGKSTLMRKLEKKFPEFNFYEYGYEPVEEPFVYEITGADEPDIPEFDIIYCIQYSKEYKERITGIKFDTWRPFREYRNALRWKKMGELNLKGKRFKKISQLQDVLKEIPR